MTLALSFEDVRAESSPFDYLTDVDWDGEQFACSIVVDSEDNFDEIAIYVLEVCQKCSALVARARSIAFDELAEDYNQGWRDRTLPELDRENFYRRLNVETIIFCSWRVEVWFDDKDLFSGHSIFVEFDDLRKSLANLEFAKGGAQYFG